MNNKPIRYFVKHSGDLNGNYKSSVLDRIANDKKPIWGFNKNRNKSNIDKFNDTQYINVLFLKPKGKKKPSDVIIVNNVSEREIGSLINIDETNNELGWSEGKFEIKINYETHNWFHIPSDYQDIMTFPDIKGQLALREIKKQEDIDILDKEFKILKALSTMKLF
jgi:hypothetical protein